MTVIAHYNLALFYQSALTSLVIHSMSIMAIYLCAYMNKLLYCLLLAVVGSHDNASGNIDK